jgi:hypothetical protein
VPLLKRADERADDDERVAEADDVDVELVESEGRWTLRLGRPFTDLGDRTTIRIRVRPNLVPGVPFDADIAVITST